MLTTALQSLNSNHANSLLRGKVEKGMITRTRKEPEGTVPHHMMRLRRDLARLIVVYLRAMRQSLAQEPKYFDDDEIA